MAQGGTAVGTGVNAPSRFLCALCAELAAARALRFVPTPISSRRLPAGHGGGAQRTVEALAVSLMKIANDLRWMNSGPLAGLGEIALPALQPGSSIMPGKVNPVIPEATAMVAAK